MNTDKNERLFSTAESTRALHQRKNLLSADFTDGRRFLKT
jgi:hypothetical protein